MATVELAPGNALYYELQPPSHDRGLTFVAFNALTGEAAGWDPVMAPLRAAGHGSLVFNYRGQSGSPVTDDAEISERQIVADAVQLLQTVAPPAPVLVGLSVGGLYAAKAWLAGAPAEGLVFLNTLRRQTARLAWVNAALTRMAEVGGLQLLKDLYLPLLTNLDWQVQNRGSFLQAGGYTPIDRGSGLYRLLKSGESVDWDLPYERLTLPVLSVTGLQDRVFLDRADVAALLARLPDVRAVEMPDAAHLIVLERPQAVAHQLLAFAQELKP